MNYLAVFAASLSCFLIGGLWYSPVLFQRTWMRANGLSDGDLATGGQARIFAFAFLFALAMAFNLAMFLDAPDTTIAWGAAAGGLSAVWVVCAIATIAAFERRPPTYVMVNGGYWLVSLVTMGTILGAWR